MFFTAQINFALEENVAKEGHLKWLWIMFFSIGLRTLKKQLLHKCKPQGRVLCCTYSPSLQVFLETYLFHIVDIVVLSEHESLRTSLVFYLFGYLFFSFLTPDSVTFLKSLLAV